MARSPDRATCRVLRPPTRLPLEVRETSGLAYGARADLLWTHNDRGGEPVLYGFDRTGRHRARVAVTGAGLIDWEDIEAGRCGDGDCLYIGDIGDNGAGRDHITIYRVAEPGPGDEHVSAVAFHARYPDGPQDAEALLVLGGELYIITKGRTAPLRLYRYPGRVDAAVEEAAGGHARVLELVRELGPRPERRADFVTAATARRDGRWVALRTYREIRLYRTDAFLGAGGVPARSFDVRRLKEPQGEGMAFDDDGALWLSTEADRGEQPFLTGLSCALEE